MENTAVIALMGLSQEEKDRVLREAKALCDKHGIELITNIKPTK